MQKEKLQKTNTGSVVKPTSRVQRLVECAFMVAVGTVLMMLRLFEMPNGGSVTLACSLPFILISFRHGTRWGLLSGLACALLQMITGFYVPPAAGVLAFVGVVLLDYVFAFGLQGLASLFAKPFRSRAVGVAVGTFGVCFLRFVSAFLSGFLIWGSITQDGLGAVIYSLTYNGGYMSVETVITVSIALLLYKIAPQLYERQP